jgi:vitamin B12/bleomycin/antimicrobial peptide transport system ATP-binding/permease protein
LTKQIKRPEQSHLLRRFWENATGFWGKRGTRLSWVLSGILLLTILLNLATSYGMNLWTREIFDALQQRSSHTILLLSIVYLPLLAASVVVSVLQVYARMNVVLRPCPLCLRKRTSNATATMSATLSPLYPNKRTSNAAVDTSA